MQTFNLFLLVFFVSAINIVTLWYIAGLYLMNLGFTLLIDDADVFVGFLWVIDLGVGLIFFVFILHFSHFLHQKALTHLSNKFVLLFFYFFIFLFFYFFILTGANAQVYDQSLKKIWFFFLCWYNYYEIQTIFNVTELNLLRELYFYTNAFEFFLINFIIFYGVLVAIVLCFLIKRIFLFANFAQIINLNFLKQAGSVFFIRNQNFVKQQIASTGTRVWSKKKLRNFNDF